MYVHPTPEQVTELSEADPNKPIVMLNLIQFAETANPGFGCDGMSGADAYAKYAQDVAGLGDKFPGHMVWPGTSLGTVIGPPEEDWDLVLVVTYESPAEFFAAVTTPEYLKVAPARDAAVADSRLVMMQGDGEPWG